MIVEPFLVGSDEEVGTYNDLTTSINDISVQLKVDKTLVMIEIEKERGLERILFFLLLLLNQKLEKCKLVLSDSVLHVNECLGNIRSGTDNWSDKRPWPLTSQPRCLSVARLGVIIKHLMKHRFVCLCLINQERSIIIFIQIIAMLQGIFSQNEFNFANLLVRVMEIEGRNQGFSSRGRNGDEWQYFNFK